MGRHHLIVKRREKEKERKQIPYQFLSTYHSSHLSIYLYIHQLISPSIYFYLHLYIPISTLSLSSSLPTSLPSSPPGRQEDPCVAAYQPRRRPASAPLHLHREQELKIRHPKRKVARLFEYYQVGSQPGAGRGSLPPGLDHHEGRWRTAREGGWMAREGGWTAR